ncbi:TetR/AcrR family transcriptional regulator [Nonomuraea sp. NPDC059007]|uniref:TetR/AcrR family transcriptional regulator n=1 Tax=Nonomuraea sp. NPDC059007 TaxID=3346692 RepID=UPI00368F59AA
MTTTRRRPRDRKQQILTAALDHFHRSGFHATGMDEIAKAVGITAGALYRHFSGKQELLGQVILDGLARLDAALAEATPDEIVGTLARYVLDHRQLGVLWRREARHLSAAQTVGVREHQRAIHQRVAGLLDRPRDEADLLAWAVLSALSSPSYHAVELPRARFESLMVEIGQALRHTSRLSPAGPGEVRQNAGLARTSRRETLLAAAITLFHERGYQAVGMEDIGAAAGIAGPSVYNHFGSKAEILITALNRANDGLQLALAQALTSSSGPREALEAVLRSYVDNTLAHSELNAMLVTEVMHLPGEQLRAMRRAQHDYILEWVGLLSAQRPELTQDEARVLVQSAMTLVNDLSLSTRARSRAHLAGELTGLSLDVLGG